MSHVCVKSVERCVFWVHMLTATTLCLSLLPKSLSITPLLTRRFPTLPFLLSFFFQRFALLLRFTFSVHIFLPVLYILHKLFFKKYSTTDNIFWVSFCQHSLSNEDIYRYSINEMEYLQYVYIISILYIYIYDFCPYDAKIRSHCKSKFAN